MPPAHPPFLPGESEEITLLRLCMHKAADEVFMGAELGSFAVEKMPRRPGRRKDRIDLRACVGVRFPFAVTVDDLSRYHRKFDKALFSSLPKSLARRVTTSVVIGTPSYFFTLNEDTYPILLRIADANEAIQAARTPSSEKKARKRRDALLKELVATGHTINPIIVERG